MCVCACCNHTKLIWFYIWLGTTAALWVAYIGVRVSPLGGNWGTCPNVATAENFEKAKYLGRWYEFARSESVPKEWETCQCQTATYLEDPDEYIRVLNNEFCIDADTFSNDYRGYQTSGNPGQAQCSFWRPGWC